MTRYLSLMIIYMCTFVHMIAYAEKNPIEFEGETLTFSRCTRDVIEFKKEGFLIQDFYLNGRKITTPFLVKELKDVLEGDCSAHVEQQNIYFAKYSNILPSIQGRIVEYYQTGQKWKVVEFNEWSNGREEVYYDKEGIKKLIISYEGDDRINSKGVFIDEEGKVTSEGIYVNGVRHGEWRYFYPKTTQPMMMRTYDKGRITGPFVVWWSNGNKQQEGGYLYGEKSGPVIYWAESGEKISWVNYIKGVREGKYQSWYQNGQLRAEGYYHSGQRFGLWVFWYKNGQRQAEGYFERNEVPGKSWYVWSRKGRLLTSKLYLGKPLFQNFPSSLDISKAGRYEDPYILKDVEYRLNYKGLEINRSPTPIQEEQRKRLEEFLNSRQITY